MNEYEIYKIEDVESLKQPTVYFWLKNNQISEHFIKQLRKNPDSIKINNLSCTIKSKLKNGDILKLLKNPSTGSKISPCDGKLEILYEDEEYLAVFKPHNLACIPTRSHYQNNLGGQIVAHMQKIQPNFVLRIINRLDKDTAGIVLVAKSTSAYNKLKDVDKTYYAICEGLPKEENFTINKPIHTPTINGINQMKRIISDEGKPSITHVFIEKRSQTHSLARLKLETGRTHQIRVHMSSIGHSLLADPIYNNSPCTETHTFLILKEVSFTNPYSNKQISLTIDFPKDWEKYIN